MTDDIEVSESVEKLTEQVQGAIRPPTMLLQSATSGLVKGFEEAAECSTKFVRESSDELGRCTQQMLARDPFGMAAVTRAFFSAGNSAARRRPWRSAGSWCGRSPRW